VLREHATDWASFAIGGCALVLLIYYTFRTQRGRAYS
jgi:hypothetical protein